MSLTQSLRNSGRALRNYITNKPLVVSFEVTYSCTCNCLHCVMGGRKEEKDLLEPAGYTALVSSLRPCVVQVSGGEPLLRQDVVDIVKAIKKHHNGLYAHLHEIIPRLAAESGYDDIELNSAITRLNLPYLIDLTNKVEEWGVSISYSTYGLLRKEDKSFFIYSKEDLEMLQQQILYRDTVYHFSISDCDNSTYKTGLSAGGLCKWIMINV